MGSKGVSPSQLPAQARLRPVQEAQSVCSEAITSTANPDLGGAPVAGIGCVWSAPVTAGDSVSWHLTQAPGLWRGHPTSRVPLVGLSQTSGASALPSVSSLAC